MISNMVLDKSKSDVKANSHASYLFNEMSKFQKVGVLCDIKVPGQLEVVPAHKVVLMSARSSSSSESQFPTVSKESDDVIDDVDHRNSVEDAYASGSESDEDDTANRTQSGTVQERLGALNQFRLDHRCCDVTLVAEEFRCDAHRVVLAACSDYFKAMFTSNMRENDMTTIPLSGIEGLDLRRVLDFMYTGEIDTDDSVQLLHIGVYYQILPLIEHCQQHLISSLTPNDSCSLLDVSRNLALKSFEDICFQYIHDHFTQLESAEVELLSGADLVLLLGSEKLGNGISNSETENAILKVALRWFLAHHNSTPVEEQKAICSLIRFALVPALQIKETCFEIGSDLNNNGGDLTGIAFKIPELYGSVFKHYYDKAMVYHERLYAQPLLQDPNTQLRTPETTWVSVDGVLAPVSLRASKETMTSLVRTSDPIRDPFHGVAILNGFIYTVGGTKDRSEGYSRAVYRYDPRLNSTIRVADMNVERGDAVVCTFGNYIYVFGGRNRRGALRTCEKYDPFHDKWTMCADMQQPIYMAAGLAHGDFIYHTGGFNDEEVVSSMYRYNPAHDKWEELEGTLMADRAFHVMVEGHDGRLWVIGGLDNPFSGRNVWEVEAYDIEDDMWGFVGHILPVKPMLSAMRLNVLRSKDGRVCVAAVTTPEKFAMLEYDNEKGMWFSMTDSRRVQIHDIPVV